MKDRLTVCKEIRKIATFALTKSIRQLLRKGHPFSEVTLRDLWLLELRKYSSVFPEGWYIPPPHGIAILIGKAQKNGRNNYTNLRLKKNWPKENVMLTESSNLLYVYASPVDRQTGIIGDFGTTLYFGKDPHVKKHLKKCLQLTQKIAHHVTIGMMFADIYEFAQKQFKRYQLTNGVVSSSDPTRVNIGHTIPTSFKKDRWSREERDLLTYDASWKMITTMISQKRKFINSAEQQKIVPGIAITIEPRLTSSEDLMLPMASFHTILLIHENGKKEVVTYFDNIFKLAGMDYMVD